MAIIFKISARFTVKELRCEFLSSFDIVSGSEEGGILFLQIVIVFGMKKKKEKKEWEWKKTLRTGIFSQTRRKKTIQQFDKN